MPPAAPSFFLLHSAVGEDFCHNLVSGNSASTLPRLNIEGRRELLIVRKEEEPFPPFLHKSEHLRDGALHDFYDFSFGTGIVLLFLCDKDLHGIPVHGISFQSFRDVNVIKLLFREAHKAEAFLCLGIDPL